MEKAARRKSSHIVSLFTCLFILFILLDFSTASGQTTGSISGTVTSSSDTPISGAEVNAYSISGEGSGSATTNETGTYTITSLPAGDYFVYVYPGYDQNYISEYYDNASSYSDADIITVSTGGDITGIDFQLDTGATISGTVTDSSSAGIADMEIYAYSDSGGHGFAYTDDDGNYTIMGLPAGGYYIRTYPSEDQNYIGEYYDNASSYSDADIITVSTGGDITGIDFQLDTGATISGTVTDSSSAGIADMEVYASSDSGGYDYAYTDDDGNYTIMGLPAGGYYIRTYPSEDQNYIGEYYDNASSYSDADIITVSTGGDITGIDFQLDTGATISGTVTDSSSAGIADMEVYAYSDSGGYGYAYTDDDGNYTIMGLSAGGYYIRTYPYEDQNYIMEYYDNAASINDADLVTISAGESKTGIDFSMDTGATISGVVYESDGTTPIEYIYVRAYSDACNGVSLDDTYTDENGTYTIVGLPTGDVYLKAYVSNSPYYDDPLNFISEWHDNGDGTTDCSGATAISVTQGEDYPEDIDFLLDEGATISGTVYESDGETPVEGIYIYASSEACYYYDLGYAITDSYGNYSFVGLSTGDVYLLATSGYGADVSYFDEYYGGATDCSDAEAIAVTAGEDYEDKDFQMDRAGSISGTIYESDGVTPIVYAQVIAMSDACDNDPGAPKLDITYSDSSGEYKLSGLSSGDVYVFTYGIMPEVDGTAEYIRNWYDNAFSCDDATPVAVTVGYDTGDIDFMLYPATDSDTDNMPDQWEIVYFGDLSNDGFGDSDNDGISDVDEYTKGTAPKEVYKEDQTDDDNDDDDGGGGGGGGGGGIFGAISVNDVVGYHLDGITKKGTGIYMPVTNGFKALKGAQTHIEGFAPALADLIRGGFESIERIAEPKKEGLLYRLGTYGFPVLGKIAELYLNAVGSEQLMTNAYSDTMISVTEFEKLREQGIAVSPHVVKGAAKEP